MGSWGFLLWTSVWESPTVTFEAAAPVGSTRSPGGKSNSPRGSEELAGQVAVGKALDKLPMLNFPLSLRKTGTSTGHDCPP